MIVLSPSLVVDTSGGLGAHLPCIGWQSLVTPATLAADHEDEAYPAVRLANPNTNEVWRSSSTATQYLTVAPGGSQAIDYLAVARHNFGSAGVALAVEANLGAGWSTVAELIPVDDTPLLVRFAAAAYAGLRLKLMPGTAAPQAAVLFCGALLVLEKGVQAGFTPLPYGRHRDIVTGLSESGEYLGRVQSGGRLRSRAEIKVMTPGFVRSDLAGFLAHAGPFFFAWAPAAYPHEVGYAWCTSDPLPVYSHLAGYMDLTLELEGLAL